MQGRRVPFRPAFPGGAEQALPGDYCKVPPDVQLGRLGILWLLVDPTGGAGSLIADNHTVTEHEDGSITVSPSLVMPGGWHGWLERGVWRSV
jgi:hypothetical protein